MNRHETAVLYGYKGSGSAAVEAAYALLGRPLEIVDAASWDERSANADLRRVNPLGQIPTLVFEDGAAMSESAAILVELGLRQPASGLLPQAPEARARSLRGLVYIAANCYAAIGVIDYPERVCAEPDEATNERIVRGAKVRLHALWDAFADTFAATTPFLEGASPGALDLLAAVVSRWSGSRQHLRASRPDFSAALERVDMHPKLVPIFERHWPKKT